MTTDYDSMTVAQLESNQRDLHQVMKDAKTQKRAIADVLNVRAAEAEAVRILKSASAGALKQIIGMVGGIGSKAEVGTPGAK